MLKSSKGFDLCQEKDSSNLTCLALALGHNAPIEVIQGIISIDASLPITADMFGASALHVACLNGSSIEGIRLIASQYKELLTTVDYDERGPLHHAVEFACQSGDEHYSYEDVIEFLCTQAPEMVSKHDKSGDSPIDLVQLVKIDITERSKEYARLHRIYSILRKTSINLYRENKKRWELEGFIEQLQIDDKVTKKTDTTDSVSSISSMTSNQSSAVNSLERKKACKRTLLER